MQRHHALCLLLGHRAHHLGVAVRPQLAIARVGREALVGTRKSTQTEAAVVDALCADAVEDLVPRAVDGAGLEVLLQPLVPLRTSGGGGKSALKVKRGSVRPSRGSFSPSALVKHTLYCRPVSITCFCVDCEAHLVLPSGQQLVLCAGNLGPPKHVSEEILVKDPGAIPYPAQDDVVLEHALNSECG